MNGHTEAPTLATLATISDGVSSVATRYLAVFEPSDRWPDSKAISDASRWYWEALQGRHGDEQGERAAREIAEHVLPHEAAESAWWASSLGRSVAWWIGYTEDAVPQQVAARILGVTRQRITKLIASGLPTVPVEGLAAHVDRSALLLRVRRNTQS